MRHILLALGLGTCAALAATPAAAQEAGQYDYLGARYTLLGDATNGASEDVTGLGLEGAKSLDDMFFVRIAADLYDVDDGANGDAAVDLFSIGPGIRVPLNTDMPVDLWAAFNYERLSTAGRAATGFGLDIGVTVMFNRELRGGFSLKSASTEAGGNDVDYDLWDLELAYAINDRLDLIGSLVNGEFERQGPGGDFDFDNLIRIGVRMPF